MKITAQTQGPAGLARRLDARLRPAVAEAALDAAARQLSAALAAEGIAPEVEEAASARRIGSSDAAAVARETGTLRQPPRPWLGPALARLRRAGR